MSIQMGTPLTLQNSEGKFEKNNPDVIIILDPQQTLTPPFTPGI